MCFLSLQFSPRPEPPNRDIAVRSLPYPPQKRRVWEALSGTAGRKHCCSFSPVPTAKAQSMGSVVRNRRTEVLLFVLSHTHPRSAGNRGSLVRKYRTEALPFAVIRGRLRRFKCRRNAGIGEALSGTAVRRQPHPAPPLQMPPERGNRRSLVRNRRSPSTAPGSTAAAHAATAKPAAKAAAATAETAAAAEG